MSCGCNDFSRSELFRRSAARAAEAGKGLPAIEAGMPLPAGTGMDRRQFLLRSAGMAVAVYGATRLSSLAFDEGVAQAAVPANGRVLVSVFLAGGIDSMSVLAPVGDSNYRRLRPKLHLPESVATQAFTQDGRLHWNPVAAPIAQLHREGKVTVMPAIGYTDPDQSHFVSRHYWEVGALDARTRTGWMGRYLDRVGNPGNPLQGLSLDGTLSPTLATARVPVAAVPGPDDYSFWASNVWGDVRELMMPSFGRIGRAHAGSGDAALRVAGAVASQSDQLRGQLAPFAGDDDKPAFTSPVAYPHSKEEFPKKMAALAAMMAAGLPLHMVSITAPGEYDTHDNQRANLDEGLKLTADTLLAFQRDLEARGLADRVMVQVWSEFGRRAQENGSAGTDHGAAGLGLLIGQHASGQMVGEFPGLGRLDRDGNLRATSDFRSVYSSLLEQWLGHDARAVIPGAAKFARPRLIK